MQQDLTRLVSSVTSVINTVGVENASVGLDFSPSGARVRIEFANFTLREGWLEGITVDEGLLYLENIDLNLPFKEMLKNTVVRIEHLLVRVSAGLVNRGFHSEFVQSELTKNSPVEIRKLEMAFAGERITISGEVHKMLTFPFSIDLFLKAENNCLKIVFENFWAAQMIPLPDWVRNLIMSIAKQKIEGKPGLKGVAAITDDYIIINPWPKIPLNIDGEFLRFGIESHYLLVEMGPSKAKLNSSDNQKAVPKVKVVPAAPKAQLVPSEPSEPEPSSKEPEASEEEAKPLEAVVDAENTTEKEEALEKTGEVEILPFPPLM